MAKRLFLVYLLVELAVVVALVYAIGVGWTLLVLASVFGLGIALAGAQARGQLAQLQRGMRDPATLLTDSALVALGSLLMVIPGLVTSIAGLLLLLPPTRSVMRPLAGALTTRTLARRIVVVDAPVGRYFGRGDVVDGEVVDTSDTSDTSATSYDPHAFGDTPGAPGAAGTAEANLPAVIRRPE